MLLRSFAFAATFLMLLPGAASAEDNNALRPTSDCPIESPFTSDHIELFHPYVLPPGERVDKDIALAADDKLVMDMHSYPIRRIQIAATNIDQPVQIALHWNPDPAAAVLGAKNFTATIVTNKPKCYWVDNVLPLNAPASTLEIGADKPLQGFNIAFSNVPWDHESECPAASLCPILANTIQSCTATPSPTVCDDFVEILKKTLPTYSCRRTYDADPVPALWLCDPAIYEQSFHLLKSLKSEKAVALYKSSTYRATLDGALAEEYDAGQ